MLEVPIGTDSHVSRVLRLRENPVTGFHMPKIARRTLGSGASGLIVSNHGRRQLDTAPATISVLPEIVDAVGGVEVYVDGV